MSEGPAAAGAVAAAVAAKARVGELMEEGGATPGKVKGEGDEEGEPADEGNPSSGCCLFCCL